MHNNQTLCYCKRKYLVGKENRNTDISIKSTNNIRTLRTILGLKMNSEILKLTIVNK